MKADKKNWLRLLAYVTGSINQELLLRNQELLLRNEYLAAENGSGANGTRNRR